MIYYPANKRYKEKNIVNVVVGFNRKTESELLEQLESKAEQETKAGYIKRLIKEDISKEEE